MRLTALLLFLFVFGGTTVIVLQKTELMPILVSEVQAQLAHLDWDRWSRSPSESFQGGDGCANVCRSASPAVHQVTRTAARKRRH
jgi:hypothetical protein